MREIKFRAWNGTAMEYGGFYIHATGTTNALVELTDVTEDSPIMQYTGLKDKNGVEIYEGDILSQDHLDFSLPVKFHEHQGRWFANKNGPYTVWGHKFRLFKVIGNIYTDKELLA